MAKRGDVVAGGDGALGRYVGRRNGVEWICYGRPQDYLAMCQAFDGRLGWASVHP